MRRLVIFLMMISSVMMNAQDIDKSNIGKSAILMVHFGTTIDETRKVTIDALNEKVKATFPEVTVVEAYTSRRILPRRHFCGWQQRDILQ